MSCQAGHVRFRQTRHVLSLVSSDKTSYKTGHVLCCQTSQDLSCPARRARHDMSCLARQDMSCLAGQDMCRMARQELACWLNTVQVDEKKPPVFDKGTLGFLFFFRVLPFLSNWDAGPRQGYPWFLNRFMNWSLAPGTFGNWHAKTIRNRIWCRRAPNSIS